MHPAQGSILRRAAAFLQGSSHSARTRQQPLVLHPAQVSSLCTRHNKLRQASLQLLQLPAHLLYVRPPAGITAVKTSLPTV
jgi:hypothetical protein